MDELMKEFDLQASGLAQETIVPAPVPSEQPVAPPPSLSNGGVQVVPEQQMPIASDVAVTDLADVNVRGSLTGVTARTWQELEELYRRHARYTGFSIRKSTQRGGKLNVKEKYFLCSCEGQTRVKKVDLYSPSSTQFKKTKRKPKQFPFTRTGCKAQLRVKLNDDGVFEVIHHATLHNHKLTRTDWHHLHRQDRGFTAAKTQTVKVMENAGLRPADGYRFWCEDAGGDESVGHTYEDHLNMVYRLRMKEIEGGDSQTVIDSLNEEAEKDPQFFFRCKMDEGSKLAGLFWRDPMMRDDFDLYGDILVFDTTYRTNKYNLICAPFVGVNNHWKNCMFACAFIANEKTESFVWVLEMFKKSMGGKCPVTIFTDQDSAIAAAIKQVFPGSRHRLCLWHLQKNAVSHFGNLKTDVEFKDAFNKCLSGCSDEDEFETCWKSMVDTYNLEEEPWFQNLYSNKDKWATALSKDFFSAGMLSSQRIESTNGSLSFSANKKTTLTRFYRIFWATVKRWRSSERKLEFNCSRSLPKTSLPMCGLIRHAAEVYTANLFRDFEQEFSFAMGTVVNESMSIGDNKIYEVKFEGSQQPADRVFYCNNNNSILVSCSCKNFEEQGWLCCHCLRILHLNSVTRIPDQYILKRWTKEAKTEVWDRLYAGQSRDEEPMRLPTMPWRQEMTRNYFNLILSSQDDPQSRRLIEETYATVSLQIQARASSVAQEQEDGENDSATAASHANSAPATSHANSAPAFLDPTPAATKGRNARRKGHFEKRRTTTLRQAQANEYGTQTPNPRLF